MLMVDGKNNKKIKSPKTVMFVFLKLQPEHLKPMKTPKLCIHRESGLWIKECLMSYKKLLASFSSFSLFVRFLNKLKTLKQII